MNDLDLNVCFTDIDDDTTADVAGGKGLSELAASCDLGDPSGGPLLTPGNSCTTEPC